VFVIPAQEKMMFADYCPINYSSQLWNVCFWAKENTHYYEELQCTTPHVMPGSTYFTSCYWTILLSQASKPYFISKHVTTMTLDQHTINFELEFLFSTRWSSSSSCLQCV